MSCYQYRGGVGVSLVDRTHEAQTVAVRHLQVGNHNVNHALSHLFESIGCTSCHTPTQRTGTTQVPELDDLMIVPFTDLLLHDMGPGLADDRPVLNASGQEWRTAPLWGIGLLDVVNGHTSLLHDGRARSVEEAILWHGGEAQAVTDAFMALSAADRAALIRFVESR